MALPSAFARERVAPLSGVLFVHLVAGDPTFEVELQRAPDSGGSPGTWATIAKLPPIPRTGSMYQDKLPLDGTLRWYRARHTRLGWTAGAFATSSVAVAPTNPRTVPQRPGGDTGIEIPFNPVSLQGIGTAPLPAAITKTLRIHASAFEPEDGAVAFTFAGTYYLTPVGAVSSSFWASAYLPKGVTIRAFRARLYRNSAGADSAGVTLYRVDGDAPTNIAGVGSTGTGWATFAVTGLTQLVGDEAYTMNCGLLNGAATNDARLQWVEFEYTMPSYDKAV